MTTGPAREALLWENELQRGRVDLQIAAQCGELLATVHSDTANSRDLRETFKNTKPFEQLRVAPAYGRIGEAFPEYRKVIEDQSKELLKSARVMVLGDLRPRNVWVNKGSIYLIDFATAHFGHPAFDLAFYCRDLCLKAIVNSPQKAAYLEAINVFWLSYFVVARYAGQPKVERSGGEELRLPSAGQRPQSPAGHGPSDLRPHPADRREPADHRTRKDRGHHRVH